MIPWTIPYHSFVIIVNKKKITVSSESIKVFSFKFVLFLPIANMLIPFSLIFLMTDRVLKGSVDPPSVMTTPTLLLPRVRNASNCLYIISNALSVYVFPPIHGRSSTFLVNSDVNEYIVRGMAILASSLNVITDSRDWPICSANALATLVTNCSSFAKLSSLIKLQELSRTKTRSTGSEQSVTVCQYTWYF